MEKEDVQEPILRRVYLTKDLYIQVYKSRCILRTMRGHCVISVNGDENTVLAHQCFGSCGEYLNPRLPVREMLIADNHCVLEGGGKIHLCHGECSRHPGATHNVLLYGLYGGGQRYMMREMRKQDPRYDEEDRISAYDYVKKKLVYFAKLENVKEPETRKELIAICNENYDISTYEEFNPWKKSTEEKEPTITTEAGFNVDKNLDDMLLIMENIQKKIDDDDKFAEYRAFAQRCAEENMAKFEERREECMSLLNQLSQVEEDVMPHLEPI